MNRILLQAAWNGDVDYLLKEIDTNPSILHVTSLEGGENPLHISCLAGHLNFAATLLKLRPKYSRELNQDGFCSLHIAAASGHIEIVKELLKVDLGLCLVKGKDRRIPLHVAVVNGGNVEVIKELLSASSSSVECVTAQGETSVHLAVHNNQFEAFQVLVEHMKQANKEDLLNVQDLHGNTALHLAVSKKQYEVVDFLLNGPVNKENLEFNSLNKSSLTPLDMLLMFRSESGDREIEEILIQAGALKSENLQTSAYTQEQQQHQTHTSRTESRSPSRKVLEYFKFNNLRDSPRIVRNTLLVIVILITTATYQATLSPPGGVWQDDFNPSTINNSNSNSNNSNTTYVKAHTAGRAVMGTHNPISYSIFLFGNSVGFYTSVYMMYVLTAAFPLRLEFHICLFALCSNYGTCMSAIAPNNAISYAFTGTSIAVPIMIPLVTMLWRDYLRRPRRVSP
ncbi:uncharacterized protein [Rutidosis leptorrhynchoides]|uniref:uncharacterized protein n=1 Tax=Rutidosis leptorrhynchoides TaxID=125765 RepID=UPI003A9A065A